MHILQYSFKRGATGQIQPASGKLGRLDLVPFDLRVGQSVIYSLRPTGTKDHQLHQQEITHGGARDGTELSDEDIRGESGEAEMDNPNRDEPVGQNDATVLKELFGVVITTAAKHPVLVQ